MITVLLIILVVLLLGGTYPAYPYNRGWGYRPFGGILFTVLVVVLILYLLGYRL